MTTSLHVLKYLLDCATHKELNYIVNRDADQEKRRYLQSNHADACKVCRKARSRRRRDQGTPMEQGGVESRSSQTTPRTSDTQSSSSMGRDKNRPTRRGHVAHTEHTSLATSLPCDARSLTTILAPFAPSCTQPGPYSLMHNVQWYDHKIQPIPPDAANAYSCLKSIPPQVKRNIDTSIRNDILRLSTCSYSGRDHNLVAQSSSSHADSSNQSNDELPAAPGACPDIPPEPPPWTTKCSISSDNDKPCAGQPTAHHSVAGSTAKPGPRGCQGGITWCVGTTHLTRDAYVGATHSTTQVSVGVTNPTTCASVGATHLMTRASAGITNSTTGASAAITNASKKASASVGTTHSNTHVISYADKSNTPTCSNLQKTSHQHPPSSRYTPPSRYITRSISGLRPQTSTSCFKSFPVYSQHNSCDLQCTYQTATSTSLYASTICNPWVPGDHADTGHVRHVHCVASWRTPERTQSLGVHAAPWQDGHIAADRSAASADIVNLVKIGQGGYGRVYKARMGDDQVAVKVLDVHTKAQRHKVYQEAQLLEAAQSPFVLRFVGLFEMAEGSLMLASELLTMDLWDLLNKQDGDLSEGCIQYIVACLARALRFIHSHDIAHLDVKAENVGIGPQGKPKLLDFGLATSRTSMEGFAGTLTRTMPPEMVRPGPCNPKQADIFALGALVYFLDTHESMFEFPADHELRRGDRRTKVMGRLQRCDYIVAQFTIDMKPARRHIIRTCMRYNPNERLTAVEVVKHKWLSAFPGDLSSLPSPLSDLS